MDVASVADRLIGEEAVRSRVKRPVARVIVAKEAGLSPGTLENLERGRLKFVDRIASKLNDLLARKIERKIADLEHELDVLRRSPSPSRAFDFVGAERAIAEAKRCIGKE